MDERFDLCQFPATSVYPIWPPGHSGCVALIYAVLDNAGYDLRVKGRAGGFRRASSEGGLPPRSRSANEESHTPSISFLQMPVVFTVRTFSISIDNISNYTTMVMDNVFPLDVSLAE